MEKLNYILNAFPFMDSDTVEKKNIKREFHMGLSRGEKNELIRKSKRWGHSDTRAIIERDWSTIPDVKQLENNKVEVLRRNKEWCQDRKKKVGKVPSLGKRWTYSKICDTLGITGYDEDVWE